MLVNAVLDRDAEGTPRVIRVAVFDATERREYERELLGPSARAEASEATAPGARADAAADADPAGAAGRSPGSTSPPPTGRPGDGDEVGGDFYDVFEIGDDDWVVVVGDVCGKGVEAAVVTALARHTIRAAAVRHVDPSDDPAHAQRGPASRRHGPFCTVVLVRRCGADGAWTVTISARRAPAAAARRADGPSSELGRPGSLLGAFGRARVPRQHARRSGRGDASCSTPTA